MNIEIKEQIDITEFMRDRVVFRITSTLNGINREIGMVTSKKDFEDKLHTHHYNPILFLVDLPTKLAYLYDCLNRCFCQHRDEIFIFWWRKIGTTEWKEWFVVNKYLDSVYGDPPRILG